MKGFALGLSLSIAFILGCVSAPLVSPSVSAQQEPLREGLTRWEYTCFDNPTGGPNVQRLNELGSQGWEMTPSRGRGAEFCFKRPI